jgi:hypothetical protein
MYKEEVEVAPKKRILLVILLLIFKIEFLLISICLKLPQN